jgi:hypothetical protein
MLQPSNLLRLPTFLSVVLAATFTYSFARGNQPDIHISPTTVTLTGNFARTQLVVADGPAGLANARTEDLTATATFQTSDTKIVTVTPSGQVLAQGNGSAIITVSAKNITKTVPVTVSGMVDKPAIGFSEHIMPVISKAGCNAGACHASQYGKGGFKLSVFGFSPQEDFRAITRDMFSRRTSVQNPAQSLLLLKATSSVAHEGGKRMEVGSTDYQVIERWLLNGAPGPNPKPETVTGLQVLPERRVGGVGLSQQLRVLARYSDGKTMDVTHWAKFDSMDESVLSVTSGGLVRTVGRGQGVAMVRFEGQATVAAFVVPHATQIDLPGWVDNNFIDKFAAAKFREIGIMPSGLCDDATFLRRATLDVTGTLPTVEQARAFLVATDPDKRKKLVDRLLGLSGDPALDIHNNEYAAYWALKWSDLIRSNSASIGEQGMWALNNWLQGSFRENKPFDRIVRELITAKGSTFSNGPANYFKIANNPQDLTESTSQLFLGVRLQCAKCHNHPYEPLSQNDYYGFAAFFARVGNKGSQEFGLFGGETIIVASPSGEVGNPRTGAIMQPTPLRGKPATATADRRQALADWLTSKENPYFARNLTNRLFAYLLGRGLVEPIDDLRATNPASNPDLLDALAQEFIKNGFNQKQLLKLILNSRLYQLDSQPTRGNATDFKFCSHYYAKRMPAEVFLDAIDQVTGTQTKFEKVPLGTRAIELPDAKYNNYFLSTFGKPRREAVCECERVSEPNLAQALHTLNGDVIETKLGSATGRVAGLVIAKKTDTEIVEELYLATLSRRPTAQELEVCKKLRAEASDPRAFYQDLLWSLLNSKHFQFVH